MAASCGAPKLSHSSPISVSRSSGERAAISVLVNTAMEKFYPHGTFKRHCGWDGLRPTRPRQQQSEIEPRIQSRRHRDRSRQNEKPLHSILPCTCVSPSAREIAQPHKRRHKSEPVVAEGNARGLLLWQRGRENAAQLGTLGFRETRDVENDKKPRVHSDKNQVVFFDPTFI